MADQLVVDQFEIDSSSFPGNNIATEDVLAFIDDINYPRCINPLDLAPQLEDAFALTEREARAYLVLWLRLFSKRYIQRKETIKEQAISKN